MDHKKYLKDKGIFKKVHYYYKVNNEKITDPDIINRLDALHVPPAWKNVWYASNEKCHIQAHGVDNSGKKQYILSQKWITHSRYKKYNRMKEFMKDLVQFKKKIVLRNTPTEIDRITLIKLLFNLLMDIHIRVGNEKYVSQNKSYGLTTLRQKHCYKNANQYFLSFDGKSKIHHVIEIPKKYNPYFDLLLKLNNNDVLFWYSGGNEITSDTLNEYLKQHMGDYTCKDFRTYSANVLFIKAFLKNAKNPVGVKKIILQSIDQSAEKLGHSRSISRKSYISQSLIDYCVDAFDVASSSEPEVLLSKV